MVRRLLPFALCLLPFALACQENAPLPSPTPAASSPQGAPARIQDVGLRLGLIRDNGVPVSNVDFLVWPADAPDNAKPIQEAETAGAGEALLWLKPGRYRIGFDQRSWRPELGEPPSRTITIPSLVPEGGVVELIIQLRP